MTKRPNDTERWLGTITIELEVAVDENPERLASDLAVMLERAIEDRPMQNNVYGWGATVREITGEPAAT